MKLFRILCCFTTALLLAQPSADPAATARKALDLLLGGKYADLEPLFTPDMQKAMPTAELAKLGTQMKTYGAVSAIDPPTVQKAGPNTVVVFPAHFESKNINFRFIVNQAGLIAGFFQLPGEVAWTAPAYSKAGAFRDVAVTIGDDQWKLPGTLTLPTGSGPFPAMVLLHSFGPNDRDETVGANKVFRDIAEGLSSRGIAVLRYEKRTKAYGARVGNIKDYTIDDEIVEDANRALTLLRARPDINQQRIYVLGHGLGGYIVPRLAEEDGKVSGIAILGGNARPIEDLVLEQAETAGRPAKELEALRLAAKKVKSLEPGDAGSPPVLGMQASYVLDLKGYDPVTTAKKLTLPILVLQGERDFQVSMKDFALWKTGLAGRKDAVLHSYPALNHLFIAGEGKSTDAEYRKPGHVAPEVIDVLAKWIGVG